MKVSLPIMRNSTQPMKTVVWCHLWLWWSFLKSLMILIIGNKCPITFGAFDHISLFRRWLRCRTVWNIGHMITSCCTPVSAHVNGFHWQDHLLSLDQNSTPRSYDGTWASSICWIKIIRCTRKLWKLIKVPCGVFLWVSLSSNKHVECISFLGKHLQFRFESCIIYIHVYFLAVLFFTREEISGVPF